MNHFKKRAAVTKYLPLKSEGKTEQEIKDALKSDDNGYTADAIEEIYQALLNPAPEASPLKYKVNFAVFIPDHGRVFTKDEIEADEDIINYLVDIKSAAVSVIKEGK